MPLHNLVDTQVNSQQRPEARQNHATTSVMSTYVCLCNPFAFIDGSLRLNIGRTKRRPPNTLYGSGFLSKVVPRSISAKARPCGLVSVGARFVGPRQPVPLLQRLRETEHSEGSRSGLLAKCFLGCLGYQGQYTSIFLKKSSFLALVLRPPKNHLANKPLRDPSENMWTHRSRAPRSPL